MWTVQICHQSTADHDLTTAILTDDGVWSGRITPTPSRGNPPRIRIYLRSEQNQAPTRGGVNRMARFGIGTPAGTRIPEGPVFALAAAALFGGATVAAKALLSDVSPWMLAGLLYLGSGLGLGTVILFRSRSSRQRSRLSRRDLGWLSGAVLSGGILAPLLLLWGLDRTPATTTSLLLNLEGALTALLAWTVFRENIGPRVLAGLAAIIAGAVLLSISPGGGRDEGLAGRLAIILACLGWAVDNNLTRNISASDPAVIAGTKGLVAGAVNVLIALSAGHGFPSVDRVALCFSVGLLGYGASLVLFVLALRSMGTARTGSLFSTAPFIGATASVVLLGEKVGGMMLPAALLMGVGVLLQLRERHAHEHTHEAMVHQHAHSHDAHHRHEHGEEATKAGSHSHPHAHEPLTHSHRHFPDIHHRHGH